ncbi:PREDICTED: GLABROUS1 enhancer-binding protein-like [Tarenaya hassleriana]|uniref:GLABROUS1 enhancer-binding protein-like n=1 Tax=Tarenaya hassleriana TaxID=28532 RepID=UPI00053C8C71|nr:PREDICTED: GLABROUS1 enhancer-binding protein-like [Tarenaya hassleriana]
MEPKHPENSSHSVQKEAETVLVAAPKARESKAGSMASSGRADLVENPHTSSTEEEEDDEEYSSESEGASGSEAESKSESESERIKHDAAKPVAAKQAVEAREVEKPRSVVKETRRAAAKRPMTVLEAKGNELNPAKKMKGVQEPEEHKGKKSSADASKKQLIERIFSHEDEIALLKGILEFASRVGNIYDCMDEFCIFVNKHMNFEANKAQISNKIKRLRKRFEKSVEKSIWKGKKGEDCVFSKAHDQESFDLSKKIWGTNGVMQSTTKSTKGQGKNWKPRVLAGKDVIPLLDAKNVVGIDEFAMVEGWEMAEGSTKRKLEATWKKIQALQMELSLLKTKFAGKATNLIFDALKANGSHFDN